MDISIDLFGFDFLPRDRIYGVWLLSIKDWEDMQRSLFCLHYADGCWRLEIFWLRVGC
jgi:hypothetical protein